MFYINIRANLICNKYVVSRPANNTIVVTVCHKIIKYSRCSDRNITHTGNNVTTNIRKKPDCFNYKFS